MVKVGDMVVYRNKIWDHIVGLVVLGGAKQQTKIFWMDGSDSYEDPLDLRVISRSRKK